MDFGYSLADFAERAVAGHRWQEFLAEVLRRHGLHVRSTPLRVRKEDEDHEPYRDESDLEVSANRRLWHIVEAKSKSGPGDRFTSPADWPYSDVTCYATRKGARDLPVLFVCAATRAVVGLLDDGSERTVRAQVDRKRGITYQVYSAPKRLLLGLDEWCEGIRERAAQ